MTVRVRAPGKVNLYLAAGRQRPDGYHPLATIFQAVDLHETVTVREADALSLTMSGRGAGLPTDDSNLAVRAAKLIGEAAGIQPNVEIRIDKQIPVAGGMAGGSADAAATLVALNELWGLEYPQDELLRLGSRLGADVPFCILGGTALGLGRGDVLTPLLTRGEYTYVLTVQPDGLSTPRVFAEFDRLWPDAPEEPQVDERFVSALVQGDVSFVGANIRNDLSESALSLHDGARAVVECHGRAAIPAFVSGSGPTVGACVGDVEEGEAIARQMSECFPATESLVVTGPVRGAHLV